MKPELNGWEYGENPMAAPGASNGIVVRPAGEFPHGGWVADCGRIGDEQAFKNARLIAAAPMLLAALKATRKTFTDQVGFKVVCENEAAIQVLNSIAYLGNAAIFAAEG